jgi:hypothetical protein
MDQKWRVIGLRIPGEFVVLSEHSTREHAQRWMERARGIVNSHRMWIEPVKSSVLHIARPA